MNIRAQVIDGSPEIILTEVHSEIGISTDMGIFGIAQRDGGIEVMLNGETVWTSHEIKEGKTMKQKFEYEHHDIDNNGNPSGGRMRAVGLQIDWQNGPLGRGDERKEPNGTFVETVIQAAVNRLQFFQTASSGKFACRENALAITKLEEALLWLGKRTADREAREAEGTYKP